MEITMAITTIGLKTHSMIVSKLLTRTTLGSAQKQVFIKQTYYVFLFSLFYVNNVETNMRNQLLLRTQMVKDCHHPRNKKIPLLIIVHREAWPQRTFQSALKYFTSGGTAYLTRLRIKTNQFLAQIVQLTWKQFLALLHAANGS